MFFMLLQLLSQYHGHHITLVANKTKIVGWHGWSVHRPDPNIPKMLRYWYILIHHLPSFDGKKLKKHVCKIILPGWAIYNYWWQNPHIWWCLMQKFPCATLNSQCDWSNVPFHRPRFTGSKCLKNPPIYCLVNRDSQFIDYDNPQYFYNG